MTRHTTRSRVPRALPLFILVLTLVGALAVHGTAPSVHAAGPAQRLGVLAYFSTDEAWRQLGDASSAVSIVVVNPASGPGSAIDETYLTSVRGLQAAGIQVLGYVATGYATRPQAEVEDDITRYFTWYGVDGIFLDEVPTARKDLPYYQVLHDFVKSSSAGALVVLDPGAQSEESEGYMNASDLLVTFEGSYSTYLTAFPSVSWNSKYPASRFWHLVYDVPSVPAVQYTQQLSQYRGAGMLYTAPDSLPNPWGNLPSGDFWQAMLHGQP
jgi:hypothetical protein